ncbi:DUF6884 domain-containing protein [Pseudomonas rhizoryzae]|uniref:DUF6884 domain-containing protein n=1 Tax=Pseudomonas rhizoryzae TaxID=2571129 RepID=UPI000ADD46E1|nr:DUF6884 domain-containing protein [Pseudomonas rhizoryzae]
MNTVCLVACTSKKSDQPTAAELIYRSPLFLAARSYAQHRADQWFILSAKHGLLSPEEIIAPYNESLLNQSELQRQEWATDVYKALNARVPAGARIIFLAGSAYRSYLAPAFEADGRETAAPMSALGIGSQVAWLQKVESEHVRLSQIDRFYALLKRVIALNTGLSQKLSQQTAASVRHERGIYFFFEDGEMRMTAPFQQRVVRIGTHAVSEGSKATLWNRLRTHRGGGNGLGNHRGSIFRLHVGESLIRRKELEASFPTWGKGQSAPANVRSGEEEIEFAVSEHIRAMQVAWLEVPDASSADSDRGYLERNFIALLAGPTGPLDLPSGKWLGRWSTREAVKSSGLWNVNHVYETFDETSLEVFEQHIEVAEGLRARTEQSLAPSGWRSRIKERENASGQIDLL